MLAKMVAWLLRTLSDVEEVAAEAVEASKTKATRAAMSMI